MANENTQFKILHPFFPGTYSTNPIEIYQVILSEYDEATQEADNRLKRTVVATMAGIKYYIEHEMTDRFNRPRRLESVKFSWEGNSYVSEQIDGRSLNAYYYPISRLEGSIDAMVVESS